MSRIKDMLPSRDTQKLLATIDAKLFEQVREQMKKDKVKWRPLLEACLTKYLEEAKK